MSLEFPDTSPFYDSERRGVRFLGNTVENRLMFGF